MDGGTAAPFQSTSLITLLSSAFDNSRLYLEALTAYGLRAQNILAFTNPNAECLLNQELILLGGEDPADPPQSRGKDLILFKDHPPRVMLQAKSNGEKIAFFLNAFQESEYVGLQIKSDFSTPPSEGRWSVRSGNYVDQSMRQQQQQQQIRRQDGTSGAFVAQACHADHLTGADALGSAAMPTRPRPRCQLRPQSLKVAIDASVGPPTATLQPARLQLHGYRSRRHNIGFRPWDRAASPPSSPSRQSVRENATLSKNACKRNNF